MRQNWVQIQPVSLRSSLSLSELQFTLYKMGIVIPLSLTTLRRSQGEDGYENCILYRVVCPLCVLTFMALSGTFSSLMPQMPTRVPSGPTLASAHESLVWRASIFPVSLPTETLIGQASPAGQPRPGMLLPRAPDFLKPGREGLEVGQPWSPTEFAVLPTHTGGASHEVRTTWAVGLRHKGPAKGLRTALLTCLRASPQP